MKSAIRTGLLQVLQIEGQWEDRKQCSLGVGQCRNTFWNRYIYTSHFPCQYHFIIIPYSASSTRKDPKISWTVPKNFFKIFVQLWNFSPLQSTPLVTGYKDPSTAPTAGDTVYNLQQKCCQGPPAILVEPPQHQHNASLSNPTSSVGIKKVTRSKFWASRGGRTQPPFCF